MIPKDCKRLAEVDFPIAVVSKHAAREKSIRHGHPSTLHLWWARRPLAACRAMLLGLLLPDPCDPLCPKEFKTKAAKTLLDAPGWNTPKRQTQVKSDDGLRRALLDFIGDVANWDVANDARWISVARELVKAAHPEETPLVVDPFAGGGSIPLEALRLGCEAFASDLNPVACLILKVMLEDIPRETHRRGAEGAESLTDELRRVGKEIKEKAEKELAEFYPKDPDLPAPRRGKFFIYVLKCSDDSFYIGQTEDIARRLKQHESGEVSWTANRLPVEIIHWEQFDSREAAVRREQDLKTGFGRKWLKREYDAGRLAARQAGGATPIAYLWARTVRCESPNCGAEIPLVRSFWLCTKANRRRALRYKVVRPKCEPPRVEFEVFEPKSEKEVQGGTVTRAKATCLCCGTVLPPERVRAQLAEQRGGADVIFTAEAQRTQREERDKSSPRPRRLGGARLLAVVTLHPGMQGRNYRLPTERDYEAVWKAQQRIKAILDEWERGLPAASRDAAQAGGKNGLCPVPDEPLPPVGTLGFRVQRYGMLQWGDLFTARQKVALVTLARLTAETQRTQSEAVREGMALGIGRCTDRNSNLTKWDVSSDNIGSTFARQALPIVWDFAEVAPLAGASGDWSGMVEWIAQVAEQFGSTSPTSGQAQEADASSSPLPDDAATVWFTDPPYYDAVPYADLSDFFFVWLKRTLPGHPLLRDPFDPANPLTPKAAEAVQNERSETKDGRPKDKAFYEEAMARAFAEGRRVLREDGVASVVFAHKTTEGWEALLSGMIRGGWVITGSWPIATEMGSRLRARDSAALATSIHLICRPRPDDAPVGDWGEVLRELPKRVGDWMERLQGEGIRGADLVFACIGPALEIFSRYRKVETADGREVKLAEYLEKVWEVVGRSALEQVLGTAEAKARNGAAGAVEEDARLTALFLWTLQSTNGEEVHHRDTESTEENETDGEEDGDNSVSSVSPWCKSGFSLPFDVVRRFAQPLGIELPKWEGRVIETEKGVVRLLPVSERAKQLFGEDGAEVVAFQLERNPAEGFQLSLFPELNSQPVSRIRGRKKGRIAGASTTEPELKKDREATTLDRVHAAMLLQAGGQANALRALIKAEQERGPDFLRLANALSALYPAGSEEKRLLDAMLLAVPR
ncbi:MAG: DUF1156 domain-containing protein [Nitrospira sp.]|nr:DUF1156 domain-containing protein [Nitrospira sp.]MCP9476206.1 DUF1156 domain-containing protein [Nitrospira sp.]